MADDTGSGPQRVLDIVCRMAGNAAPQPLERARPGDTLIGGLGFESIHLLRLGLLLADAFDLDPITMENTVMAETVADLSVYVWAEITAGRGTLPAGTLVIDGAQYG